MTIRHPKGVRGVRRFGVLIATVLAAAAIGHVFLNATNGESLRSAINSNRLKRRRRRPTSPRSCRDRPRRSIRRRKIHPFQIG